MACSGDLLRGAYIIVLTIGVPLGPEGVKPLCQHRSNQWDALEIREDCTLTLLS